MRRAIRNVWRRVTFLVRRNQEAAALDEEMEFHLECRARDMRERGLPPDDAKRAARRAFGNTLSLRESAIEMWGWGPLDRLAQDVRWAVRTLGRTPAFSVAAILTLALGIGVNTAIFTVVRAQLLRPLPYPAAERLAWIFQTHSTYRAGEPLEATEAAVDAWRQQSRSLESLATFVTAREVLTGAGEVEELAVGAASPELFQVLGATSSRGRLFTSAENQRGQDQVAVLSHTFWQHRFGGSEAVIGRQITLGGRPFTVIGILRKGFGFAPLDRPRSAWLSPKDTDVWVPVSTQSTPGQAGGRYYLGVIGRLRPGTAPAVVQAELARIVAGVSGGRCGAVVTGLQEELVRKVRLPLLLLTGAASFVLLIVCANVAHLQLARGMARGREMAIRTAVGAGRWRLVRQLLVEAAVLATTGGLLGLLVASASLELLPSIAGEELLSPSAGTLDGWVLGYTLIASFVAALLFGMFPARQAAKADLQMSLKEGGRGPARHTRKTTAVLVVAEVALALVLVAGAALMVNTVWRLRHAPIGFQPDHLLTLQLKLPPAYAKSGRTAALLETFLPGVRALPGIEAAEAVNTLPMGGVPDFASFTLVGIPEVPDARPVAQYRVITPGYFNAMRIPLRRGRVFTEADRQGAARVAIVNETMERVHFNGDALGRSLTQAGSDPLQVVGVVGDIRHESLRSDPLPEVYHPLAQRRMFSPWLAVRTGSDATATVNAIRKLLAHSEPGAAIADVKSMEQRRAKALGTSRFLVFLLIAFAGLALVLALVGSYGVVAYWVSRRRQEFGVRLALGAPARCIVRLVLRETLTLIVPAVALGVAGAAAFTRLLSSYLYQVEPTDPITMAVAVALVLITALYAAYLPARRAGATDPVIVLREE